MAVLVAGAAVIGALLARGPSPWIAAAIVAVALAVRWPWALVAGVLMLTGSLSARARAGLVPPSPGPFDGWVTVLSDAEPAAVGVRAEVRLGDGRHVEAEARRGSALEALRTVEAGERLLLTGRLEHPPPSASWLGVRHVSGVLAVDDVRARGPGSLWVDAANSVRDLLGRGAAALPARDRSLFLGFVLGDTRGQPVDVTDDFRGAGLSHLLAVSGQNVAFVLALAGPLLRRVGLRVRLPATLVVILFFALVTRFEPSVLRASAMAALAVTAATLGRPASSVRLLALAISGLVILDPFLVQRVGFQLSVGACIGIVVLSPRLTLALPLPRMVAEPLAVTLAAQAGVAPALVAVFGGVPVAGVPANVLATPVAGPVMVWGLPAGMLAGALGGTAAVIVQWPTHLMIAWIAWVAHRAALLPLGEVGPRELVALGLGAVTVFAASRLRFAVLRRTGMAVMAVAVAAPALALRAPPPLHVDVAGGAVLWRADAAVLELDGRVDAAALLEDLRRAGVGALDVVVGRTSAAAVRDAIAVLRRRYAGTRVLLPSNTSTETSITVGRLRVDARPAGGQLHLDVALVATGDARAPPARQRDAKPPRPGMTPN